MMDEDILPDIGISVGGGVAGMGERGLHGLAVTRAASRTMSKPKPGSQASQ
jgi:hypothetical protein